MDETIRVLLIGDYSPFLIWLQLLLEEASDIILLGLVNNGLEALGRVLEERPDVVILGCQLLGTVETGAAEAVKHMALLTNVLMYSSLADDTNVHSLLQAGAAGCLLVDAPTNAIIEAIRAAAQAGSDRRSTGESYSIGLAHSEMQQPLGLTERESQVMELMSRGSSNKEISRALKITERTVEFHVSNILRRTGQATRLQAVLWAADRSRPSRLEAN